MTGSGIVVFTGPTLAPADVRAHLHATVLPPVSQGDVYRATATHPWAIVIIDGYFERVPAVWHKEILWAMSRGIHCFGAASMGALRAAELAPFGMVGIGRIFEAFRDGILTDDDEVAVRHHGSEAGFRGVSEAMVNIRATVDAAAKAGLVTTVAAHAIIESTKQLHYAQRTYPAVLEIAAASGVDRSALEAWLPGGRVDQKRLDAVELLHHVAQHAARDRVAMTPSFHFEHTDMWEHVGRAHGAPDGAGHDAGGTWDGIADEVRLARGSAATDVFERAFARAVGLEQADREGIRPSAEQVATAAAALRASLGVDDELALERWLEAEGLGPESFRETVQDDARLEHVRQLFAPESRRHLLAVLRRDNAAYALRQRARQKQDALRQHGVDLLGLADSGLTEEALVRWYFSEVRGESMPTDLDAAARRLACDDAGTVLRMLLREWWYRRLTEAGDPRHLPEEARANGEVPPSESGSARATRPPTDP